MHAVAADGSTADGSEIPTVLPDDGQIAYTVPHAAEVIDMALRTMWYLVREGTIKSIKIGNSRRITRVDLIDYINSRRDAA